MRFEKSAMPPVADLSDLWDLAGGLVHFCCGAFRDRANRTQVAHVPPMFWMSWHGQGTPSGD